MPLASPGEDKIGRNERLFGLNRKKEVVQGIDFMFYESILDANTFCKDVHYFVIFSRINVIFLHFQIVVDENFPSEKDGIILLSSQ